MASLFDSVVRLRVRATSWANCVPDAPNLWDEAARAADDLAAVLPKLRGITLPEADRAIADLQQSLFMAREYLDAPVIPKTSRKPWHDYAVALAQAYQFAAAQGGHKLGISAEGPVTRFVLSLLPYVTGDRSQPQVAAVRQLLRRAQATGTNGKRRNVLGQNT